MKYELAKKLKDAGFPQTGKGELYETDEGRLKRDKMGPIDSLGTYLTEVVYIPTLSELIEECNPHKADSFSISTGNNWTAYYFYVGYFDHSEVFKQEDGTYEIDISCDGGTPEEAVANLYLALNAQPSSKTTL